MYKTNEIVNKFLLADDKLMSEMHLKQPQYSRKVLRTIKIKRKYFLTCQAIF